MVAAIVHNRTGRACLKHLGHVITGRHNDVIIEKGLKV